MIMFAPAHVSCPSCRSPVTVPLIAGSTQRLDCRHCGAHLEVDPDGSNWSAIIPYTFLGGITLASLHSLASFADLAQPWPLKFAAAVLVSGLAMRVGLIQSGRYRVATGSRLPSGRGAELLGTLVVAVAALTVAAWGLEVLVRSYLSLGLSSVVEGLGVATAALAGTALLTGVLQDARRRRRRGDAA